MTDPEEAAGVLVHLLLLVRKAGCRSGNAWEATSGRASRGAAQLKPESQSETDSSLPSSVSSGDREQFAG